MIRECAVCCEEIADDEEAAEVVQVGDPTRAHLEIHATCWQRDLMEIA